MDEWTFAARIGWAAVLGAAVGLERQYRRHPAGLRTVALVCVGAAAFVALSPLLGDTNSPTRIASYVVSGVGFLGGGVILREGASVRGITTAAALWCAAAVGTLAGSGFPVHAFLATVAVLGVLSGLRPVADWVDARRRAAPDAEFHYHVRVVCDWDSERLVRTIVLRHLGSHRAVTVQGLASADEGEGGAHAAVVAEITSAGPADKALEEVMSRLNIEPAVRSVRWEKAG